jgi:hypothetical protein
MLHMHPDVTAYIQSAPQDLRPALLELREMIITAYPQSKEQVYNGQFPIYTSGDEWLAGFAWRSRGPMLYIMDQELVAEHAATLGKLASGKACLLYKPTKSLDGTALRSLYTSLLRQAAARRRA